MFDTAQRPELHKDRLLAPADRSMRAHQAASTRPNRERPADLPDAALSAMLIELDRDRNRLDAQRIGIIDAWDARGVWAFDGARAGATWLATHTESSRAAASHEIKLARSLRSMPTTSAAFTEGDLGLAKVRILAEAAHRAPEPFIRDEPMLVRDVIGLRVDEAKRLLAFWLAHANPESDTQRSDRVYCGRNVHLSQTFQNGWALNGDLPDEGGEILKAAIDRWASKLYESERAACAETGDSITSTPAQRRADALVEIAKIAMADENGTAMNVPSITGIVDITALTERCADHDANDDADPAAKQAPVTGAPVGETENGLPISPEAALRLLCDCHISRVVTGPTSAPVDLGMTARLPSPAQRRALAVRDGGCTFPGCDRPPNWSHAHHIVHWVRNGPTDLENLTLLCNYHHHRVHEGGFGCTRGPDGALAFTRPDGTPLTVPKSRRGLTPDRQSARCAYPPRPAPSVPLVPQRN